MANPQERFVHLTRHDPLNEPRYSYEGVANPGLRKYLERFEVEFMRGNLVNWWPFRISRIRKDHAHTLNLTTLGLQTLARKVKDTSIVGIVEEKARSTIAVGFDKDGMRALAAFCGTYTLTEYHFREMDLTEEDLARIAQRTREFLGNHPLAKKIHDPNYQIQEEALVVKKQPEQQSTKQVATRGHKDTRPLGVQLGINIRGTPQRVIFDEKLHPSAPVAKEAPRREVDNDEPSEDPDLSTPQGAVDYQRLQRPEAETRTDAERRVENIYNKFPHAQAGEADNLSGMRIENVLALLRSLPNTTDDVLQNRYDVPLSLIRGVMFVLMTHAHQLAAYNQNDDSYSLIAFRRGLMVCAQYMAKTNAPDLAALIKKVEDAVLDNPRKYW